MIPTFIIVASAVLAIVTPAVFVAMRTSVKSHRQQIITDLAIVHD